MTKLRTTDDRFIVGDTDSTNNNPFPDYSANWQIAADDLTALETGLTQAQAYIDARIADRQTKPPCRFATTTNVSLTGLGALPEGTPVAGDRILVVGQTDSTQDGIYAAASGAWTRTTDADGNNELLPGCTVWVYDGSTYADSSWELSSNTPVVPGTTAQTWLNTYRSGLYAAASALAAEISRATTAEAAKRIRFNDRGTQTAAVGNLAVWDSIAYDVTSASISDALPSTGLVPGDEIEVYVSAQDTAKANILTLTGTSGPFTISIAGHGVILRWTGAAWVERQDRKSKASLDAEYKLDVVKVDKYKNVGDANDIAAVTAALAEGHATGKTLLFAARTYSLPTSTTFTIDPTKTAWIGSGPSTKLDFTGSTASLAVNIGAASQADQPRIPMQLMNIAGPESSLTTVDGVKLGGTARPRQDHLW